MGVNKERAAACVTLGVKMYVSRNVCKRFTVAITGDLSTKPCNGEEKDRDDNVSHFLLLSSF